MKRLEKIQWSFLTLSELGIVVLWIAGFNDRLDISAISFITAGICAFITLFCIGLTELRKRNYSY